MKRERDGGGGSDGSGEGSSDGSGERVSGDSSGGTGRTRRGGSSDGWRERVGSGGSDRESTTGVVTAVDRGGTRAECGASNCYHTRVAHVR